MIRPIVQLDYLIYCVVGGLALW